MKRFLIIQTAFLGDVILATPIFSELKRIYPDAFIDVVVRKGNESLLQNNPNITTLFCWDKKKGKYRNLFKLIKKIRSSQYDEVITLQRFFNAGLITLFSKSKKKIGFKNNSFSWMYALKLPHSLLSGMHEVERNLSTIRHHRAEQLVQPELFPSNKNYERVSQYKTTPYFCLAPASVWNTKRLPLHKWEELIHHLIKRGTVYLIGGPDDLLLCNKLISSDKIINLAGKLSLLESAALMKDAKMNFVNDSGPLHIASAMNAPTRAFFCSTVPLFGFGPLSSNSKIIESKEKLTCKPCTYHGRKKCPLKHYKCGNTIDVSPENLD